MHVCECKSCNMKCPNEAKISAVHYYGQTLWFCIECFDAIIRRLKRISCIPNHPQFDVACEWLARAENQQL